MIFAVYFVLLFLILRFAVTVFNFVSDPKLRRVNKHYTGLVSILIPARNEEANIAHLLRSIQQQDYQDYEVFILDDSSTDNTLKICTDIALTDKRFKVIEGGPLPAQWLGKNYACHQLARHAKGQYFMFIDADEQVNDGLINSAIHRMKLNKLSLLSLFTNQVMLTTGEKLVVPMMHFMLLNLLPVRLVLLVKNASVAAASGQFMFFKADDYHQHTWHQAVKAAVVEDVEIMRQVKARNLNGETLLANGMLNCRMYTSYTECLNGFSKNFLAAFNYNITAFLIFLTLLIGGPMLIIITTNLPLILFTLGLIVLTRIMMSLLAGQNVFYNVVLHPLQMLSLTIISYMAIQKHLTKTNVWKGRRV
ncbi:chlorobactene glucosyltransferase [Mucilaginibacter gracilis]|uniref:Chlorobactene glucosyltransferase n=1 Tax=Mucilaginibacter gracilis TaxID=423350 RepID=A0A495J9H6_9SPHI|nr:glycosyltransferase family 2 protein [Mucilaginibacter gracilis]RKR85341.1 chlorobactene glucosyltransferase [Mucilaginibacter gracilis]